MKKTKINKVKRWFSIIKRRWLFSLKQSQKIFHNNLKRKIRLNWTWPKKIFLGILIILFVSACLLYTPIAYNYIDYYYENNQYYFHFFSNPNVYTKINFAESLFMATSAFTNTGLSVIDISTNYSIFGQVIIWIVIQIGGFGFISIFYLIGKSFMRVTGKRLFSSSMMNVERGGSKMSDSSKMIVRVFFVVIIIQIIFAFSISGILYSYPFKEQYVSTADPLLIPYDTNIVNDTYQNYSLAFWKALFVSTSSINNAGFDLFGISSLSMLRNDMGISIQFLILILLLIGGIGFPIIYDITKKIEWFYKNKIYKKIFRYSTVYYNEIKPKFSSFSKICIWMFFIVGSLSILSVFTTEYISTINLANSINPKNSILLYPNINNTWGTNESFNKNWAIAFNTLSTRSAGFATVNMSNFSEISRWIFILLMFIGTSPSSTGGGIRVTTLAVASKTLYYWTKGVKTPVIQKKKIPTNTISNSFIVIVFATALIFIFAAILYFINSIPINGLTPIEMNNWTYSDFIFECSSAFGTTGLSMGITMSTDFQWWSYIFIIILMFIGQLGITPTLVIFAKKIPTNKYQNYVQQDVRIG